MFGPVTPVVNSTTAVCNCCGQNIDTRDAADGAQNNSTAADVPDGDDQFGAHYTLSDHVSNIYRRLFQQTNAASEAVSEEECPDKFCVFKLSKGMKHIDQHILFCLLKMDDEDDDGGSDEGPSPPKAKAIQPPRKATEKVTEARVTPRGRTPVTPRPRGRGGSRATGGRPAAERKTPTAAAAEDGAETPPAADNKQEPPKSAILPRFSSPKFNTMPFLAVRFPPLTNKKDKHFNPKTSKGEQENKDKKDGHVSSSDSEDSECNEEDTKSEVTTAPSSSSLRLTLFTRPRPSTPPPLPSIRSLRTREPPQHGGPLTALCLTSLPTWTDPTWCHVTVVPCK